MTALKPHSCPPLYPTSEQADKKKKNQVLLFWHQKKVQITYPHAFIEAPPPNQP